MTKPNHMDKPRIVTEQSNAPDLRKAEQILHELEGLAAVVEEVAYATDHPDWTPRSDMYTGLSFVGQSIQRSAADLRRALWPARSPEKDAALPK